MKKSLPIIILCFMFIMQAIPCFSQCGDVNSTGSIDIVDALLIARYYVGLPVDNFTVENGDVSGDNNINIVDALLVAQYYVGLITEFPGGCQGAITPTPTATIDPSITPGPMTTNSLGAGYIRVNQAGYLTSDNYKTAVVADLSGSFQIVEYGTNSVLYEGSLTSLGSDSITGETLYLADFSSFSNPGIYVVRVGNEESYKFEIKDDLYNEVLYYTLRVYGANRCGPYDSWIHEDCHTLDGSIRGSGEEGSMVGGWHDCGDHVKFGGTLGYTAAMMLFSYNAWPDRFGDVYSMNYDGTYRDPSPDGIPDVINEVKVTTDYLLNLYDASVEDGLIEQNQMYYQVGDGDDDHNWWHKPENQDAFGQVEGGAPREIWSDIASDLAGRFSASLSMMYLAYGQFDATYAERCLEAARVLYDIGKNIYGQSGDTGGKGYYAADGRMDDDMALAGVELYKATGEDYYINDTTGTAYWMAIENKWQFASYYVLSYPNVFALALYDYYEFASVEDSDPSDIFTKLVTKAECIEWLKWDVTIPQQTQTGDLYGRRWNYDWGTCRYMMGVAANAVLAYDLDKTDSSLLEIAKDQMNWIFGRNQFGMSFVVGNKEDNWLSKYPQSPHHRAANPEGENVPELPAYEATELTGGTIGGPSGHTEFSDLWSDYTSTETGIDYWAGTFFTAAYFADPNL